MKVLNVMYGRDLGGLEQAALDYHEALAFAGHDVCSVLHTTAAMRTRFGEQALAFRALSPKGEWDPLAARRLRHLAREQEAEAVIAHGNRAIGQALRACTGRVPVIGVAHNYRIRKRFSRCDAVFCITRDLIEECVHLHMDRRRLFHIPNLIRVPVVPPRTGFHEPVTIGTLGRFVEKKGMDIMLHTVHALQQQDVAVRAIIGGDGPLAPALAQQARAFGLDDQVTFPGWITDKQAFFASLDLFVLPSHHEPFGIVLIEAMAAGLPCVTTATEGPCEIIRDGEDALMVDIARPYQMAQAIRELIEQPARALAMGRAAHRSASERFALPVISRRLSGALAQVKTRS